MQQKTMNQKIIKIIVSLSIFFVFSNFANAATGDMLYQNCAVGGSCDPGPTSGNGWFRTVESNGCKSGSCLKLTGTFNTNSGRTPDNQYGAGSTSINGTGIANYDEITVTYWVKLIGITSQTNNKDFRFYVGSTQYTASSVVPLQGSDYYMDRVIGTVRPASWFNMVVQKWGNGYPIDNGDGTYYSWDGYMKGSITAGGPTRIGSAWQQVTKWVRLPTSSTSQDGAIKVWIGGQLALDITNFKMKDSGSLPYFTKFTVYPSSENSAPFEHWMDEMIIYEGYVPPASATGPTLSNHQPSTALPSGTTATSLGITTNVNSTCRYSKTAGVAYASMSDSFTGAETTIHTRSLTGLTNGSSTNYYVKCVKTSDGSANASDYQINVSVLPPQYNLGVVKLGTGDGTVVSSPAGINCGDSCNASFNENASVTLNATQNTGSIFEVWSGCNSVSGNQCTMSMTSNKTATITFNSTSVSCDEGHFWLCLDGPCQTQGFHFWEGACRTIPAPTDWTGTNIATNGTFANWTNNLPDSWSSYTASSISEDSGACNIGANGHIYRSLSEIKTYRYAINIRNFADLFETWTDDEGSFYHYATDGPSRTITGLISYDGEGDRNVYFGQGTSNIVVDDIVIKETLPTASFRSDVDGSSQINTTDALLTLRHSLGLSMNGTAWQVSTTTGDVNCDGVSNSTDALLILRHSLGLNMSGTTWCE